MQSAILSKTNMPTVIKRSILIATLLATMFGVMAVFSPKADAAWVNARSFDQNMLNTYCRSLSILQKGAANYGGSVADWYCVVTPPSWINPKGWLIHITPGRACQYNYGGAYRFVTTNYWYRFGGYCAVWR